jgi:hypothetical protein
MCSLALILGCRIKTSYFAAGGAIPQPEGEAVREACPVSMVETACVGACEGVPACVPARAMLGIQPRSVHNQTYVINNGSGGHQA